MGLILCLFFVKNILVVLFFGIGVMIIVLFFVDCIFLDYIFFLIRVLEVGLGGFRGFSRFLSFRLVSRDLE